MSRSSRERSSAIYVASPEGDTGKSTIALGILHRLAATVAKVGVFRPITRRPEGQARSDSGDRHRDDHDYILELLLAHTTAGLSYDECVGVDYQQLHADPDSAISDIVDRYHRVAEQCDAVVIVGSDYTDVTSPSELSVNARDRRQPRRPGGAGRAGEGPHPGRRRARRRALSRGACRPARPHRRRRRQPL